MPNTSDLRRQALTQAQFGDDVANVLHDVLYRELPEDFPEIHSYVTRLRLCNAPHNQFTGTDLHKPDGECYDARGRLWTCGLKLCPYCVSRQASRNRRRARTALERDRLTGYQSYKFLTLTSVNPNLSLTDTRAVIYYAWTLLRKTQFWGDLVEGYIKDEEFTVTKTGIHYHLHLITKGKFMPKAELRTVWTACMMKAYREFGLELQINTEDGELIADIRRIGKIEHALNEVCKYITKTDSWSKLRPSSLLDLCRIRQFPRMFELGGCFRTNNRSERHQTPKPYKIETRLDTTAPNDGKHRQHWRDRSELKSHETYLRSLFAQVDANQQFRCHQLRRKYPYADFRRPRPHSDRVLDNALRRFNALADAYFSK